MRDKTLVGVLFCILGCTAGDNHRLYCIKSFDRH